MMQSDEALTNNALCTKHLIAETFVINSFMGGQWGNKKLKKKKLKNYCFLQVNKITHLSIIKPFTLSKQINLICTNNCIKLYNSFLKSLQFKTA